MGRRVYAWVRRGAAFVAITLVVTLGMPAQNVTSYGPVSWSHLWSWLATPPAWSDPVTPDTPRQQSGTAAGKAHTASAADTRSGGGTGSGRGTGKGQLGAYVPYATKYTPGLSGYGVKGFNPKRSTRVAAKSSATTTYYANPDGSYTRTYSQTPVNYRDASGTWQPIDTGLRQTADGRWHEKANALSVSFATRADDPALASVGLDATHTLSYRLEGALPVAGVATASSLRFPGVQPGTDLVLSPTRTGEREDIVLHSADVPASWIFDLDLGGLRAVPDRGGAIDLVDASGRRVGRIPAGQAYDSAIDRVSGEPATTHKVSYRLATVGGHTQLVVSLDTAWLHDPARRFPVTVDPSVTSDAVTTYAEQGSDWVGDHSNDIVIKVGAYDGGTVASTADHRAQSYLTFPELGLDRSYAHVSGAVLHLFDTWASYCSPEEFDVAPVTQSWTPSGVLSYASAPTLGGVIGRASPNVPNACHNTGADRSVGDGVDVTMSDVSVFNAWANGAADYGLGMFAPNGDTLHWKQFSSDSAEIGGPSLELTYDGAVMLPTVQVQRPANGTPVTTLTPELSAIGSIDGHLDMSGAKFDYQIYDAGGAKVIDSGLVGNSYVVPAGKLQWGKTYLWTVQASDGTDYSINPVWYQLTTQVPQPLVTSSLSQNGGHGFDPSIGNYTTSSTDADVATVGPDLSIVRNFNSRDPRTSGAFGAGWSDLVDAKATERYDAQGAVSTVVVTYPDGSQVGFGRNGDGSFTAPLGRAATLIRLTNGYELVDKAGTTYSFTTSLGGGAFGIGTVTDLHGRAESFTWSSGHVTTIKSVTSGRTLTLGWTTPSGASSAHVATVRTDPVTAGGTDTLTWTYGYTGDQLLSVCPPGTTTACTTYGYDQHPASQYRNQVLDLRPGSYWPLDETSGTVASSAVVANEGADNATYTSVSLGQPAPLAASAATAAGFDGTASMVGLPSLKMSVNTEASISLWFNAPAGAPAGVLFGYSDAPIKPTPTMGNHEPVLYLGSDGHLLGEFWETASDYTPNPVVTPTSYADGKWHHVLLTGSQSVQVMYVDGVQIGTTPGPNGQIQTTDAWQWRFNYLGTGLLGPDNNGVSWPDQPYTDGQTLVPAYFKGSMADVAFWPTALTAADATALYRAGTHPDTLLTSITRPSGKAYAAVTYDQRTAAVTGLTDENGGTWGLAAPSVAGSSQVFRSAVMGPGPLAYYRLGDTPGAVQPYSEVKYAPAAYSGVTLGVPGRFTDEPAAQFNGSSGYVSLPSGLFPTGASSQDLWFNTTSGGVLLSSQASALGGAAGPALPVMWIASDGRLRGLSPSTTPIGPLTAMKLTNKCVDDSAGGTANGTHVQIWTCTSDDQNQSWSLFPDGTIRFAGKCLDIDASGADHGTGNGDKLLLWDCTGGYNQVWQAKNGSLVNPTSGRCLDDPAGSLTDGTQLEIWDCNGGPTQLFAQSLVTQKPVNDGLWHHAVLTSSGAQQALYLDGVKVYSSTDKTALTPGGQPNAFIGAGDTGTSASGLTTGTTAYFSGSIGDVAFYPVQLSDQQVGTQFVAAKQSFGLAPMTTVTVTDPGGKPVAYQYDTLMGNRPIAQIDGLGNKTTYGYDTSGFLDTVTDPDGDVITTGHDSDGNEVSRTTCQNQASRACSTSYSTYAPNTQGLDVAKNAKVTTSGDYTGGGGWSTASMVDGNTTSVSGTAEGWASTAYSSASNTSWVQLDFGAAKTIDRVDLYARNDDPYTGLYFPQNFTIAVSTDGTNWTTVASPTGYAQPTTPAPASFGFAPTSARYVKVTATLLRGVGSEYRFELAELIAFNDRPDPSAGQLLTTRDARSTSATDNTYLTTYGYDSAGALVSVTTPPVPGFPTGRKTTIAYTDGKSVMSADNSAVPAPAGLAYKTTSPGGATNAVAYLHNGDVASTTDADKLATSYAYDNLGRVATRTVAAPGGNLVTTFGYDGRNQVTSETDPSVTNRVSGAKHTPTTKTTFDADGNITAQTVSDSVAGGDAARKRTYTYNTHDQQATSVDPLGNTTTYTYDGYGRKASETDPLGTTTAYTYDANGHLLTQVLTNYTGDPVNKQSAAPLTEESRAYDPAGRLASLTDAMGGKTSYTYTDNGLVATVTKVDAQGNNPFVLQSNTYDPAGNLTQRVTGNGATTTAYTYDAAARQTSSTLDPTGARRGTTVSYTADDVIATSASTDASGATLVTSATYDPMGHVTSKSIRSDGAGHPTGWWRLGQTSGTSVVDASGTGNTASTTATGVTWSGGVAVLDGSTGAVSTNGPVLTTTASYSVSAWVDLSASAGTGAVVAQDGGTQTPFNLGYDAGAKDWRFSLSDADTSGATYTTAASTAGGAATGTWVHLVGVYDAATARITLYVNGSAAGSTPYSSVWQGSGALQIGRAKVNGAYAQYLNGQVSDVQVYQRALSGTDVSTLFTAGRTGGSVASSNKITTSWALDSRGYPTSMTDGNGNVTSYTYDEAGHLTVTTAPTVTTETSTQPPTATHPTTYRGYDTFGEVVETKDADGNITTTGYDADGHPVTLTAPSYTQPGTTTVLTPVTTSTYDAGGNRVSVKDPLGHTTTYLYDQLGDLAKTTAANGAVTHATYDTNGDRLSVTDPTGGQTQATYDHLGRQFTSTVIDRAPSTARFTTTNSYAASTTNPGGARLAAVTSATGVVTTYGYDALGQTTSVKDGVGNTTKYSYDFLGRRTAVTAPDKTSVTSTYDQLGDVVTQTARDSTGAAVLTQSATYDSVGHLLSAKNGRGYTTTFTYDATGLLTQEVQPVSSTSSITTTFGYDAAGNRTRFTDGRNNAWIYTYNTWNKPESVIEPTTPTYTTTATRTSTVTYDAGGEPVSRVLPGGVTVSATYDTVGNLLTEAGTGADAATASRAFTYDLDNRMTSAATGAVGTVAATSDAFTYNDRGLLLSAKGSAGTSSFGYTDDGLMSKRTDSAGSTSYSYDKADRLSSLTDAATGVKLGYSYNSLSQVSSVKYGTSQDSRSLSYDSMHRLKSDTLKTSASATVASIGYTYDANSNLASKTTTGFAGAATNAYSYDQADRLTSWKKTVGSTTTTTSYGYDASGNRTKVGANVYTYDARDELTSDGTNTYTYTARGTLSKQNTSTVTTDAYGQTISQGGTTFTYDAVGRVLKSGSAVTLAYSGAGNTPSSDAANTYSRDPAGGLVGIGKVGGTTANGLLAWTDQHTDVVGDFTATGTALAGSTAYDPLGNVIAGASPVGQLGYQSGWTDKTTGKVNMAARWYNPATGQFMNKDTASPSPVPNSAATNPFAYVDDNPMLKTDPSGHGWWSDLTSDVSDAWDATSNFISNTAEDLWNTGVQAWDSVESWTDKHVVQPFNSFVNKVEDKFNAQLKWIDAQIKKTEALIKSINRSITQTLHNAQHFVSTAYHATVNAVKATGNFIKNHAAAIGEFVVSTAAFMGCEAVLGAFTAGVGAVAGAVVCGAVAGAVGGLFHQGIACATGKGSCSAGSFLKAGVVGGVIGGLSGLGGALGGKLLTAIGGKALRAVGGLFGRGGTEGLDAAASDGASSAADGALESGTDSGATSATDDAAQASSKGGHGDSAPADDPAPSGAKDDGPAAGKDSKSNSCGTGVHSFVGSTPVVLADGSGKPIDQVKVGDTISNSVPGDTTNQSNTVSAVIVTKTDHDFVDVSVRPVKPKTGTLARAAVSVAAAAVAVHGGTLTTTYHHPFYDATRSAFVEARDLRTGDELQTPTGYAVVTGVRLYHATAVTYDLTIGDLHTYYVMAGNVPVLVHNVNTPTGCGPNGEPIYDIPGGSIGGQGSGQRIPAGHLADYDIGVGASPGSVGPMCSYCRINPATSLDHVEPRSIGGDTTDLNETPACTFCNSSKGARTAPVNPPPNYTGPWPPPWWPPRMR